MKLSASRSIRYAVVAVVAAFALSACSLGGDAVPQDELEKDVAAELNDQSGEDNPASCEGDLDAEEDATQQCTWTSDDGQEVPVEVKATKVDGDQVEYSIDPKQPSPGDDTTDQEPDEPDTGDPVERSVLEKKVREQMENETKKSFPVSCEGDLAGKVGATQRCVWNASDGSTLGIDVELTGYSGGNASFHIQADEQATPAPKNS